MPDTFDVDHAFEALAHDVMGRAAPPSAVHAISQARRRRRTTIASVVAAAAIVVAGVAVPTLVSRDDSSRLADADGLRPLPPAAAFAPAGWGPVGQREIPYPNTSACLRSFVQPVPVRHRSVAWGHSELARGDDRLTTPFADFGDDAGAADQLVEVATAPETGCGTSTPVPRYAGGELQHFSSTEGGIASDLWVARIGNSVALSLAVSRTPATSEEVAMMADALMAALRFSATWVWVPVGPTGVDQRTVEDFGKVIHGWFPAWREVTSGELPCVDPLGGDGSGVGIHGVFLREYVWPTNDLADVARETFFTGLAECNATRWQVERSGPTSWIATSDAGTLWFEYDAGVAALLTVRGGVNPPTDVRSAVAARLTSFVQDQVVP